MHLEKEQTDLVNESAFQENAAIDEVDFYEENEEIYKWLSCLLVIIWAVTLIFF